MWADSTVNTTVAGLLCRVSVGADHFLSLPLKAMAAYSVAHLALRGSEGMDFARQNFYAYGKYSDADPWGYFSNLDFNL